MCASPTMPIMHAIPYKLAECYSQTSLIRTPVIQAPQAADSLYFMLILQKLWALQWVWPIIACMCSYCILRYGQI